MTEVVSEITIDSKIVAWDVKTGLVAAPVEVSPEKIKDIDPRRVSIERREEGSWPAIISKCTISGATGTKKIYFAIGFGMVEGVVNGEKIRIERPLEFFIPGGQSDNDQEWITATMRSLSLAARAGFVAKALKDFCKVVSGSSIWYGKYPSGKTRTHSSLVATLAWAMQEELHKRGFLTADYEEEELDALILKESTPISITLKSDSMETKTSVIEITGQAMRVTGNTSVGLPKVADCEKCGEDMVLRDGCPTCVGCGYSKCG